MAIYHNPSLIP